MITASDVHKRMLKASEINQASFDQYLEEIIIPRFEKAQKNKIKIIAEVFIVSSLFAGKVPVDIIKLFNGRGFRMEFMCDDKPHGNRYHDYYELEIPPQPKTVLSRPLQI